MGIYTKKRKQKNSNQNSKKQKKGSVPSPSLNEAGKEAGEASGVRTSKLVNTAVIFGYVGAGFSGLQVQTDATGAQVARTVEGELRSAFLKSGLIPESTEKEFKVSRGARTDKGVSAAANVLALKLAYQKVIHTEKGKGEEKEEERNDTDYSWKLPEEKIEAFKKLLPSSISIYGFQKVTKKFDARAQCDRRKYEYLLPLKVFQNIQKTSKTSEKLDKICKNPEKAAEELQKIVKVFEGTHNFHNFSSKIGAKDGGASRYILESKCEIVKIKKVDGEESFFKISFFGQSFLFNQIRKMVFVSVQVLIGISPFSIFEEAFSSEKKFYFRLAPPQGLLLDKLYFEGYNLHKVPEAGLEPMTFDESTEVGRMGRRFKEELIYGEVSGSEDLLGSWVRLLELREEFEVEEKW